jgi:hypothetical protein
MIMHNDTTNFIYQTLADYNCISYFYYTPHSYSLRQ